MSRIGKSVINVPDKVSVEVASDSTLTVKGPKGELKWTLPAEITLNQEGADVTVETSGTTRQANAMHGTTRSLIANMIQGVSEGFEKKLEIQGVGFRAAVKGKNLDLSLGFSHPVLHPIPDGLDVKVDENTKISVAGIDKQLVGQFAAEVRSYYKPEPYKGKGVRYVGEYVRRKAGKSVQK
ncbi:MAG: 50S ribosomal protein L6 [Verrucomicrobiota bacterium]